jgi:murein L,D-transpeptidase YafK
MPGFALTMIYDMTVTRRFGWTLVMLVVCLMTGPRSASATASAPAVDHVEVYKAKHELRLVAGDHVVKRYRVALGRQLGKKERAGDNRTPEGTYVIDYVKSDSKFHRALHISYPNANDYQQAVRKGVSPGGDIMIHGLPGETALIKRIHELFDWTKGCIALTNPEIDEVAQLVHPGTPIVIYP